MFDVVQLVIVNFFTAAVTAFITIFIYNEFLARRKKKNLQRVVMMWDKANINADPTGPNPFNELEYLFSMMIELGVTWDEFGKITNCPRSMSGAMSNLKSKVIERGNRKLVQITTETINADNQDLSSHFDQFEILARWLTRETKGMDMPYAVFKLGDEALNSISYQRFKELKYAARARAYLAEMALLNNSSPASETYVDNFAFYYEAFKKDVKVCGFVNTGITEEGLQQLLTKQAQRQVMVMSNAA